MKKPLVFYSIFAFCLGLSFSFTHLNILTWLAWTASIIVFGGFCEQHINSTNTPLSIPYLIFGGCLIITQTVIGCWLTISWNSFILCFLYILAALPFVSWLILAGAYLRYLCYSKEAKNARIASLKAQLFISDYPVSEDLTTQKLKMVVKYAQLF